MDLRTMRKETLVFLCAVLILATEAQSQIWIVNPGVKVGYTFGPDGGFISGIEVSVTTYLGEKLGAAGVLVSVESLGNLRMTHVGIEYFPHPWVGVSLGPTFIRDEARNDLAWSTTIFGGMFVLPYYRAILRTDSTHLHEIGTFVKLPIPLGKIST
ncbi:MAG: hypothetical protein HYZ01_13465 [Ignavibacteriales bacterium]|nr:hypothetical protein [Ignavibacteriales bacterium]